MARASHRAVAADAASAAPTEPLAGSGELFRDLTILGIGLAALVAWDAVGLDLPIERLIGNAGGFSLRDHWFVSGLLHTQVRAVAWALGVALAVGIWKPLPFAAGLDRRERIAWALSAGACALLIALLKRASLTSCPWSLAEFGGAATYVSHWLVGRSDGGPGHCFPAGHASAALCFLPAYFIFRRTAPVTARRWLIGALLAGAILTLVQMVRGAHYLSHSLWTGWYCWGIGVATVHLLARGPQDAGT